MSKRWFFGLSLLLGISLLIAGCQAAPTVDDIVAKLKEVEASTDDAHVVLEMNFEGQGMDEDVVIEVWEKRPNLLRAEVLEASDSEFLGGITVSDGHQVWMYQPSQNEVVVGELGADGAALSPREMIQYMDEVIQRVLDTSDVKLVGEEEVAGVATYKLELTPTDDAESVLPPGGKATLWVDKERWVILQAHFTGEPLGQARMLVRSFELNTGLADDLFQFEVPDGVQVTNLEDKQPVPLTLDEARAQAGFPLLVPSYLPEGATLVEVLAVGEAIILHYDHSTTSFTIVQGSVTNRMPLPAGSQESEVAMRGQTATLISDGDSNRLLTWVEDGVTITIAGRISQDEILEVAESLQ